MRPSTTIAASEPEFTPALRRRRRRPHATGTARDKTNSAPGVMAKPRGTPLKRGAATQVMTYPRIPIKEFLVEASQMAGKSLSSFMVIGAIEKGQRILKRKVPKELLEQYR